MYKSKRATIAKPVVMEGEIGELTHRNVLRPRGQDDDDDKPVAENIQTLLQRVSANAVQEIDLLISELQISRERVLLEGERVQQQLAEYATLNQSIIQTTQTLADNLRPLENGSAARSAEKMTAAASPSGTKTVSE